MLLELKNITKSFSQQGVVVKAVDNVSLVINESENIGLVGESGCGKTTLARIIIKLYGINSGQIIFDGTDVTKFSQGKFRPLRKRLQMVFQDPYSSLDSRFTVRSILKEA
ncbi:MAG: ABC-type oligopeptide transport system ATPase subunit, partial [Candidatus Omnitrophota bacterium]